MRKATARIKNHRAIFVATRLTLNPVKSATTIKRDVVPFVFAHWLENGNSPESPELAGFFQNFAPRIAKIHFSVPRSRVAAYRRFPSRHCCASWSGIQVPDDFVSVVPKEAHWVIEGLIPTGLDSLLKDEITLLRMVTGSDSMLSWQAG